MLPSRSAFHTWTVRLWDEVAGVAGTVRRVNGWTVEQSIGEAGPFHHRDLTATAEPTVWIHRVERPALVLGSSQHDDIIDHVSARSLGIEVCSRRSGGGLVLVEPHESCWIDVLIPPTHRLWSDDVNRAFEWVGRTWLRALSVLGASDLSVHAGPLENAEAGRFLCFAGLGPGEVVQHAGTARSKVVGLSQRRQRNIARFQGLFVNHIDHTLLEKCVQADSWPPGLRRAAIPIGPGIPIDASLVADAFVAALPAATR